MVSTPSTLDRVEHIDIFVPVFAARDAIGSHTIQVRRLLDDIGVPTTIYTLDAKPEVRELCQPLRRHRHRDPERSLAIYEGSVGSAMADYVTALRVPVVLNYHNITPSYFFRPWEPEVTHFLEWGRLQLEGLAPRCDLAISVSQYNARELTELGYRRSVVAPVLVDTATFDKARDETLVDQLASAGATRWLFVGRLSPNKAQQDVVRAFAAYRQAYDPTARLDLVGGMSSHRYFTVLEEFIEAAGLGESVRLWGSVSDGELAALYEAADVFVCLSEHEGFCVPLLEAMHHEVPIVALAAAAVPETLGGAGVILGEKSPAVVAAAVARVCGDRQLRARLVAAGRSRLDDFSLERSRQRFLDALGELPGEAVS